MLEYVSPPTQTKAELPEATETPKPTPTSIFPKMPGGYLEKAVTGEFAGTTVIVDGSFTDIDRVKFDQSMKAFEEATSITVEYIGGPTFEESIADRVTTGNAPDIADFERPNLLANFVPQGLIVDPDSWVSDEWLNQQYDQSWLDMAMIAGQSAGVWHRFNTKSLVWYPKDDFDAAGYEIPTTWDELIALMDMIVTEGDTPWCIGFGSGSATGWPATDWLEDFVLRTTSLENYDQWILGELPFSSPEIKQAAETVAEIWFNDDYVYDGTSNIPFTFFGDSPAPMFEDPPKCWLHKQDPLVTFFFPDNARVELEYGVFLLPEIDPAYGSPMLVTGHIMVMFNDRPEVRALMEYLMTPNSLAGWLETGGVLAAHQTAIPAMYANELDASIAALVPQATGFRYDASDLMPPGVGSESFQEAMVNWLAGWATLEDALVEIDASWP